MSTDATPTCLSPTARTALQGAAAHPEHRAELPTLRATARHSVIRSMLRAGLVEEVQSQGEDWPVPALRATALGLQAVAAQLPNAAVPTAEGSPLAAESEGGYAQLPPAAETAPLPFTALARRLPLRTAAEALLTA
jgi:hypothetical protein